MPDGENAVTETGATAESYTSEKLDFQALAAELEAEETGTPSEQPAETPEEPTEEPAEESDEEAEAESVDETDSEEADPVDDSEEPEPEVDTKALEQIQRKEKRAAKKLEEERAEIAQLRAKYEEARREFEESKETNYFGVEDLRNSFVTDPAATLQRLGIDAENFEEVSRMIYGASPAAADNPAAKQTAKQLAAQKQIHSQFQKLQDKIKQLEARETERVTAAEFNDYARNVRTVAKEEYPLTAKLLDSYASEKAAAKDLRIIVAQIERETGERPDAEDVSERIEQMERRRLELYGVDVDSLVAKPKTKTKQAAEAKTAKPRTISSDLGTKTTPQTEPLTYEQSIEQAIKDAEAGVFDD